MLVDESSKQHLCVHDAWGESEAKSHFHLTSELKSRCSSGAERFLGKEEVRGSIPLIGSFDFSNK